MFQAFELDDADGGSNVWPGWRGVNVRLINPDTISAANDNGWGIQALLGGLISFRTGSFRVGARALRGPLPLLALALAVWWGTSMVRDQQSRFDEIAASLTDHRLLDAGPIAVVDCGPKGCADPSDTIYRFAVGGSSCFTIAGTRLVGAPGEDDLGTGMLVVDERGRKSLFILDDGLRSVARVATDGVASRPCPKRPPAQAVATPRI